MDSHHNNHNSTWTNWEINDSEVEKIFWEINQKTVMRSAVVFARKKHIWELKKLVGLTQENRRQEDEKPINKDIIWTINSFLNLVNSVLWNPKDIWQRKVKDVAMEAWNILINNWNKLIWLEIINIALTIENILLKQQVEILKDDHVTWLPNRLISAISLDDAIKDKNNNWTNYWIVLIDIDHFKRINDEYWHDVWDITLSEISKILKEEFRWDDTIWRWWWEEFIIIMKWWNKDLYIKKMNSIKNLIEDKLSDRVKHLINNCSNCSKKIQCSKYKNCLNCTDSVNCNCKMRNNKITVSIWISSLKIDDDAKSVVKRADDWLYKAKNAWRNRIEYN